MRACIHQIYKKTLITSSLSRVPLAHGIRARLGERDLGFALPCHCDAALPWDALPCAATCEAALPTPPIRSPATLPCGTALRRPVTPCDAALPPCHRRRRSAFLRSAFDAAAALPLFGHLCCSPVWPFPSCRPPPPCLSYSASSQLLISSWSSRPPCRHPLMSLSPLSRRGCPGNPESTLS